MHTYGWLVFCAGSRPAQPLRGISRTSAILLPWLPPISEKGFPYRIRCRCRVALCQSNIPIAIEFPDNPKTNPPPSPSRRNSAKLPKTRILGAALIEECYAEWNDTRTADTAYYRPYFVPTSKNLIPPSKSGKTRRRLARPLVGRQVCRLGGRVARPGSLNKCAISWRPAVPCNCRLKQENSCRPMCLGYCLHKGKDGEGSVYVHLNSSGY